MTEVDDGTIRAALAQTAEAFGGAARDTILNENGLKHVREIARMIAHLPEGGIIVDVGGGLGVNLITIRALRPDAKLILADRFEEYTDDNRMGSEQRGLDLMKKAEIAIVAVDFWPTLTLDIPSDTVDVATSFDVIEHLPGHPVQHLSEIHRVLKPGGIVVLASPNAGSLMKRVHLLTGKHPYIDFTLWVNPPYYQHYREYTAEEHQELLRKSGFSVDNLHMCDAVTRSRARNRWHRKVHPAFSATSAALHGMAWIERFVPRLRHSVEVVGRK